MYKPPTITTELGRTDSAIARNSYRRSVTVCEEIDGVGVDDLVQQYGSPLFVFSERTILNAIEHARKAFPHASFAWSYKTNYLKAICKIFHKQGWIAEVVSEFEHKKAEQAGVDIIYNGPYKTRESLERAIEQGSLIQIDNWDELHVIEELVSKKKSVNVGIRVWMDTKLTPVWSKFGFEFETGEALRAALRIVSNPHLKLHTLHSHIGTYVLQPGAYAVAAEYLLALREAVYHKTAHVVSCINLGGGFPSSCLMHDMPEDTQVPSIEDYAEDIMEVFNRIKHRPLLRLETGRNLIDEAGYLIASVVAVKSADRGMGKRSRGSYILDAGVNLLYTSSWFRINAMPTKLNSPESVDTVKLYGCLCMNIDVIREEVDLPPLEVNDKLVLHPVGAYNLTQSMQFINLRPAVVLIGRNGVVSIIRRREELSDIDGLESI